MPSVLSPGNSSPDVAATARLGSGDFEALRRDVPGLSRGETSCFLGLSATFLKPEKLVLAFPCSLSLYVLSFKKKKIAWGQRYRTARFPPKHPFFLFPRIHGKDLAIAPASLYLDSCTLDAVACETLEGKGGETLEGKGGGWGAAQVASPGTPAASPQLLGQSVRSVFVVPRSHLHDCLGSQLLVLTF